MKIVTKIENIKQEDNRSVETHTIYNDYGYMEDVKVLGCPRLTFHIYNNSEQTIKEAKDFISNSIDDKLVFDLIIEPSDKVVQIICKKKDVEIKDDNITFYTYEYEIK